jgi:hypothetical protein
MSAASATVVRPRIDAWAAYAARAQEAAILAEIAREAVVRKYLAARAKRRARAFVEQFEFTF